MTLLGTWVCMDLRLEASFSKTPLSFKYFRIPTSNLIPWQEVRNILSRRFGTGAVALRDVLEIVARGLELWAMFASWSLFLFAPPVE